MGQEARRSACWPRWTPVPHLLASRWRHPTPYGPAVLERWEQGWSPHAAEDGAALSLGQSPGGGRGQEKRSPGLHPGCALSSEARREFHLGPPACLQEGGWTGREALACQQGLLPAFSSASPHPSVLTTGLLLPWACARASYRPLQPPLPHLRGRGGSPRPQLSQGSAELTSTKSSGRCLPLAVGWPGVAEQRVPSVLGQAWGTSGVATGCPACLLDPGGNRATVFLEGLLGAWVSGLC